MAPTAERALSLRACSQSEQVPLEHTSFSSLPGLAGCSWLSAGGSEPCVSFHWLDNPPFLLGAESADVYQCARALGGTRVFPEVRAEIYSGAPEVFSGCRIRGRRA
jgi:hypothetical protein